MIQYSPPSSVPSPSRRKTIAVVLGVVTAGAVALGCGAGSEPKTTAVPTSAATSVAPAMALPATSAPTPVAPTTSATPTPVAMPDLVGLNAAVASDKLQKLGFTNIQYGSQDADSKVVLLLSNWTVTKQSTKKGDKVDPTDVVVLTCTKKA